jgi:hypothetical protein
MQLLKEHLSAYNYSWINEATFTGEASRRLFNRYNGNQLLFVLNLYASLIEGFTVNMGLKIEDRLMNQLPVMLKVRSLFSIGLNKLLLSLLVMLTRMAIAIH